MRMGSLRRNFLFSTLFAAVAFKLGFGADAINKDSAEFIRLYNGVLMPRVGLGTAALKKNIHYDIIKTAYESGFRSFDGAEANMWYDDPLLGKSLKAVMAEKGAVRKDLFITTKLLPRSFGATRSLKAVEQSLKELQTDYLDLLLLHFPFCDDQMCDRKKDGSGDWDIEGDWKAAYKVLVQLYEKGVIRSFGVSNFDVKLLKEAMEIKKPHVLQNWMDPFHKDEETVRFCSENEIAYTSYSTFGSQWNYRPHKFAPENPVFVHPQIKAVAKEFQSRNNKAFDGEVSKADVAEVILRWALQKNVVVLPRSNSLKNIARNGEVIDSLREIVLQKATETCEENSVYLGLTTADMKVLDNLEPLE